MTLEIKLPVRDRNERLTVKSASELASLLSDPVDEAVARECFFFFLRIANRAKKTLAVGTIQRLFEGLDIADRKTLLSHWRRQAGLAGVRETQERRRYELAQKHQIPDPRPLRIGVRPGGALVDLNTFADEDAAERSRQASLAAQREAQQAEAAVEANGIRGFQQAVDEQARRELPPHLR